MADREIHDSHPHATETYDVRRILQDSSNVGAVKIGQKMGEAGLSRWIKAFGFGKPTGVDFPGEEPGIVHPVDEWSDSSIGNIPMGQGIAVTPIQMASAFSAVAYNGWQVKPRLVAQVGATVYDKVEKHRVIPGKVAREVREMLAAGRGRGHRHRRRRSRATRSRARRAPPRCAVPGGYAKGVYVASFIGMVPADHPRLVVLCAVNGTPQFGGDGGRAGGQEDHAVLASSGWRSRRERAAGELRGARGARSAGGGRSGRIRRDEAERAGRRGLGRDGARRPRHRDPGPRLPHA